MPEHSFQPHQRHTEWESAPSNIAEPQTPKRSVSAFDISPGQALCSVARRYQGMAYLPSPIGRACVDAILRDSGFPQLPEAMWNDLVNQVSASLHDDPASLTRLQNLWANIACQP